MPPSRDRPDSQKNAKDYDDTSSEEPATMHDTKEMDDLPEVTTNASVSSSIEDLLRSLLRINSADPASPVAKIDTLDVVTVCSADEFDARKHE